MMKNWINMISLFPPCPLILMRVNIYVFLLCSMKKKKKKYENKLIS